MYAKSNQILQANTKLASICQVFGIPSYYQFIPTSFSEAQINSMDQTLDAQQNECDPSYNTKNHSILNSKRVNFIHLYRT